MKQIILSIFAGLAVMASPAFATGVVYSNPNDPIPNNPSQVGVLYPQATNGTSAAGYVISNLFPYPYTAVPALITVASSGSVTNTSVTPTNFVISASSTNVSIAWQAYAGYQRIEAGLAPAGLTNISFPVAYIVAPVVQLTALNTNSASIGTVTTTNFTVNIPITNGASFYWTSFGAAFSSGPNIVNY